MSWQGTLQAQLICRRRFDAENTLSTPLESLLRLVLAALESLSIFGISLLQIADFFCLSYRKRSILVGRVQEDEAHTIDRSEGGGALSPTTYPRGQPPKSSLPHQNQLHGWFAIERDALPHIAFVVTPLCEVGPRGLIVALVVRGQNMLEGQFSAFKIPMFGSAFGGHSVRHEASRSFELQTALKRGDQGRGPEQK